jgi:hypothetical protein
VESCPHAARRSGRWAGKPDGGVSKRLHDLGPIMDRVRVNSQKATTVPQNLSGCAAAAAVEGVNEDGQLHAWLFP